MHSTILHCYVFVTYRRLISFVNATEGLLAVTNTNLRINIVIVSSQLNSQYNTLAINNFIVVPLEGHTTSQPD
jgi:hypothetical protein